MANGFRTNDINLNMIAYLKRLGDHGELDSVG